MEQKVFIRILRQEFADELKPVLFSDLQRPISNGKQILSQVFKTLDVDALILYRMKRNPDLLRSPEHFRDMRYYRKTLNSVQYFADYVFDVSL